jgi:hypothetical protein
MKRTRTLDQVRTAQQRAVDFESNVLGDDERADEIEDESPEDYAADRGLIVINPSRHQRKGRGNMPRTRARNTTATPTPDDYQTMSDLLKEISETAGAALDPASSRRELVEALQSIYDSSTPDDTDGDDMVDEEEDDDDDEPEPEA